MNHRKVNVAILLSFAVAVFAAFPAGAQTLLALVDTGELYASGDGGNSWTVRSTLPVSGAAALIAGATPSELYLASASGVVYRSLDGGVNWTARGVVSASDVVDMAGRTDGGIVVLTGAGTAWLSTDQGATFSGLGTLTASNHVSLVKGADTSLYTLTRTGEVAQSVDNGATWSVVGAIPVSDAVSLRRLSHDLFVLTDTGLTYKSSDSGATWTAVGTVSQVGMRGLVQYVDNLVAVNREGLVARSTDGSSWSWVGTINQLHVTAVANDVPQTIGVPDTPPGPALVLAPIRPNPAVSGSPIELRFTLPEPGRATIALYDVGGRRVGPRVERSYAAADAYSLVYEPGNLPAGVYYLRLQAGRGLAASRSIHILR